MLVKDLKAYQMLEDLRAIGRPSLSKYRIITGSYIATRFERDIKRPVFDYMDLASDSKCLKKGDVYVTWAQIESEYLKADTTIDNAIRNAIDKYTSKSASPFSPALAEDAPPSLGCDPSSRPKSLSKEWLDKYEANEFSHEETVKYLRGLL